MNTDEAKDFIFDELQSIFDEDDLLFENLADDWNEVDFDEQMEIITKFGELKALTEASNHE